MLEKDVERLLEAIKLSFCRRVFTQVREREGSLSAMEVFSLEVIHALKRPTIGQFARFTGISQPNATYKVNSLIRKGYLLRVPSAGDGREHLLELTDKFHAYNDMFESDIRIAAQNVARDLSAEEEALLSGVIARFLRYEAQETPGRADMPDDKK